MPRWRHSSTSYFGAFEFVFDEFEHRGVGKVGNRKYRLEHGLQALVGTAALRLYHHQELVVGRLLNLNEVRHLRDFLDFSEKLSYALPTDKRLRHHVLSLNRSIRPGHVDGPSRRLPPTPGPRVSRRSRRLSRRPLSIATIGTGVEPPIFRDSAQNPNHLHSTAGDATRSPAQITDFHHLPRFWPYAVPAVPDAEDQRPSV